MGDELREMAAELSNTAKELAGVAEAAMDDDLAVRRIRFRDDVMEFAIEAGYSSTDAIAIGEAFTRVAESASDIHTAYLLPSRNLIMATKDSIRDRILLLELARMATQ